MKHINNKTNYKKYIKISSKSGCISASYILNNENDTETIAYENLESSGIVIPKYKK
ncbi:hypothetical protein [Clostridium ganghwense]|uniref:Uncharacterized protein n=1 Tax=Clostridium ganghwense TaxID=312089 RepID=A0ABT4CRY4_9CLOT|nr:hypothetical protein [Clostridium ganghwense]MCY6371826.1 hypothetical protein [Clostridium ganghwense]